MTTSASTDETTTGWKLWVPAAVAPIACILADLMTGPRVMTVAPATVLTLTAIGIASLAVSRNHRQAIAGRVVVGPLWVVAGVTLALGATFTMIAGIPVFFSVLLAASRIGPEAFLAAGLLGVMPLWTGITYMIEARALTEDQIARFGRQTTGAAALAGAVIVLAIVCGTVAFDIWGARLR